jgi:hypothetical protein
MKRPSNPRAKGLVPATFRFAPDQLAALRREALRRAGERGSAKPDASELIREAVNLWLRRHGAKPRAE